jgi:hypothetical protein
MTPALSLSYSSTAGNGVVGVGWSLGGGISRITKCNKTIAIDGIAEAHTALCLDGARLVDLGNGEWRTENDSFSRIRAVTGQGDAGTIGYVVERKDGRILRYREKTASRVVRDEVSDTYDFEYDNFALSSEEDRDGNALNYYYKDFSFIDHGGVEYRYLSEISYGNTVSVKGVPDSVTGSRTIIFNYDESPRPDPVHDYIDFSAADGTLVAPIPFDHWP